MVRFFAPIILLCVAIGLFVLYTNPTYQKVKELRAQQAEYDQALTKSQQLLSVRNNLIAKRNTFNPDDLQKLSRMLPDNVDNIRLILDTDTIAGRYNLRIRNVSVSSSAAAPAQSGRTDRNALAVGASGDPVGSVELAFSVSARYEDFTRFLRDLERSVRIVDVRTITFDTADGELVEYSVLIKTYWLR